MLKSVQKPSGAIVSFEYDALGRRTAKIAGKKITRYLWDGNVLLHEWSYDVAERPVLQVGELGALFYDKAEPIENTITWVYEDGSFTPIAKLVDGERFSIVSDYLGTPIQAFDSSGELIWERELNIYGGVRKETGIANFVAMRYQGQYFDEETGLCYNRHRYFESSTGLYISQDPIGLEGDNPNMYGYSYDSNTQVDIFGLDLHHIIPQEVYKIFKDEFKDVVGYVQNVSKKAADVTNLIDLDKPFHGNHPKYNDYVKGKVKDLVDSDNLNLKNIRKLQDEMLEHISNAKKSGLKLNDYFKEGFHLKNIVCK